MRMVFSKVMELLDESRYQISGTGELVLRPQTKGSLITIWKTEDFGTMASKLENTNAFRKSCSLNIGYIRVIKNIGNSELE